MRETLWQMLSTVAKQTISNSWAVCGFNYKSHQGSGSRSLGNRRWGEGEAEEGKLWAVAKLFFVCLFVFFPRVFVPLPVPPEWDQRLLSYADSQGHLVLGGLDGTRQHEIIARWRATLLVRSSMVSVAFCAWPCRIASLGACCVLSDGCLWSQ